MLVLDFGGQYSQLIARRVREARVYSELVSHRLGADELRARNPAALILSGGPASVYAEGAPLADPSIFGLGVPTLGICYGMQLMARELGGAVEANDVSEYGKADVELDGTGALFHDLAADQVVWMSHRDSVTAAPAGARVTASSETTPIAAFEDTEQGLYGVQFHPEVVHTPAGPADPRELPLRRRRGRPGLDPRSRDRGAGRAHPGAGGLRARDLRPLGWRRLGRRGPSRPQGGGRPAHVRVRRPRPPARERGRAGRRDVRQPLPRAARPRRRPRAVPHPPRRRDGARGEARDRRGGVHPRLRGGGARSCHQLQDRNPLARIPVAQPWATSASSSRARCTRT